MKRLIIILISAIGYLNLFGQDAPMAVAGKVYVGNTKVYSKGPVHLLDASVPTLITVGKINVADINGELRANTIILYSSDLNSGLLQNSGKVKGLGDANPEIILRKKFEKGQFTYMSLPFNVLKGDVKAGGTSTILKDGKNADYEYLVYEFDYKTRADAATNDADSVWKEIGSNSSSDSSNINYDILKRGVGYQFYHRNGGAVDFYADSKDFDILFSTSDKKIPYPVYKTNKSHDPDNIAKHSGWAFIGSPHVSDFLISGDHVGDYKGTVYYRNASSQSIGNFMSESWSEVVLNGAESAKIAPYTPFFVQNAVSPDWDPGTLVIDTFVFKHGGLLFSSAVYRSSQYESNSMIKDLLYFTLSKGNTFDRFYLSFSEEYAQSFRAVEDAVKMTCNYSDKPAVWSLQDDLDEPLVVNGLPTSEEQIVRIGFSVPETGVYTISLEPLHRETVRNAVLLDNLTGKKVDLLECPYSFQSEKNKDDNERFVLFLNSSFTSVPTVQAGAVFAYVEDNILTVKNLGESDRIRVLDLTGRTVATGEATSGREFSVPLSRKGVYVVNVGSRTSVLKVLNK